MQQVMKIIYEGLMILLVMLTIITIWAENTYNSTINWVVWAVFFIDFIIRFIMSKEKWNFIKQNPFLLIAIIPFDQFFQMARVVRIIYFFRIKTITKYYVTPFIEKLTYRSLIIALSLLFFVLLAASLVVWNVESTVNTFFHALFAVFSHLLFFGHRIFAIEDSITIWVLTGTSIIGVVLQGLALQWAFNKADKILKGRKKKSTPRDVGSG
ncbi:transporter [Virgibacillus profundi]|uniref:Transporter n=1 Tax=Virgibacillus profundi TaxID=2024555 RepID=A0A2A2IA79_9BACI|nr:transporter [Virgibacillus profundi]PAV28482.1 transporter [Virgibacillus profundi]PXY52655.1 transporter [Virgibacillus profundi]